MKDFTEITRPGITPDGQEKNFKLSDFKGQKIVLYFYPKDHTSGCTQEACQFRDSYNRLLKKALVIGVSPDSIASHRDFQKAQNLNFILLSDPDHQLSEAFSVWKETEGSPRQGQIERSTFILDENGRIEQEWRNVMVKGHVDMVLKALNGAEH